MANENIQDIKAKVKALLMKAADAAATPSEAESAMRLAQKLMAKYQIDQTSLDALVEGDWRTLERRAEHHKIKGWYLHPVDRYCSVLVGQFCGVIPYIGGGTDGELTLILFGLDADVELASWMLAAFKDQLEHDWNVYKRFQMESKRLLDIKKARLAFVRGFTSAVSDRLRDWMFRDANSVVGSNRSTEGKDLVIRKRNLAEDELARRGIHLHKAGSQYRRPSSDNAAAGAGYQSGQGASVGGKAVGGARIAIGR